MQLLESVSKVMLTRAAPNLAVGWVLNTDNYVALAAENQELNCQSVETGWRCGILMDESHTGLVTDAESISAAGVLAPPLLEGGLLPASH